MDVFSKIEEVRKNKINTALAIVVNTRGSTPGKLSSKMLIYSNGTTYGTIGGGSIEKDIIEKGKDVINNGQSKIFEYTLDETHGYMCGGYMAVYVEPIKTNKKVIIFGAGHVGKALTKILTLLEYYIIVIDDRAEFANSENIPDANEILVDEFLNAINKLNFDEDTYVVVVTRDHGWDLKITKELIKQPVKYIGVIGSKKKADYIRKETEEYASNKEWLKKLYTPIGIPIKSITPIEIAVSIAAQIIDINNRDH